MSPQRKPPITRSSVTCIAVPPNNYLPFPLREVLLELLLWHGGNLGASHKNVDFLTTLGPDGLIGTTRQNEILAGLKLLCANYVHYFPSH